MTEIGSPPAPYLRSRAHRDRRPVQVHTDTYRFSTALVAILLVVTLDVTNYLDTGTSARYLVLLIPFGAMGLLRLQRPSLVIRRTAFSDRVLFVMMVIGLFGSAYGRLFLHTGSTALPIFVPMTMAFLYLLTYQEVTEEEVRRLLLAIALIGLVYVFFNALANSGLAPSLRASRSYRNAKVLYIALGFAAVLMARQRFRLIVFSLLAIYVFKTYPSATAALVAMATLVTLFLTRRTATSTRYYIAAMAAIVLILFGIWNFTAGVRLADAYFGAVHKRNNTNTRLALWKAGIQKFEHSPVYGDLFTGETTVLVFRRAGGGAPFKNPYNNDYILFAASGGVIGLALLLTWIIATEVSAIRRYRGFIRSGQMYHAALMRVLLVGFNAWFTAAAFNPLFQGMARSVTLFAIYGLMMCLGRPESPLPGAPRRGFLDEAGPVPATGSVV